MSGKSESATAEATRSNISDGGYGWVVVASVFTIAFLSFGAVYSIGLFLEPLVLEFECSRSAASAIATINFSVQCFIGPLINMIHDQFGTRVIAFVGCLIISLCFIFSAFAPSILFLYVVFGLFGGLGVALAFQPVFVVITFYFEKKLAVATAISGVGWFIGRFAHPHFMRYLLTVYDWRGAFLLTGGITLNSVAASLLLHPQSPMKKRKSSKSSSQDVEMQAVIAEPVSSKPSSDQEPPQSPTKPREDSRVSSKVIDETDQQQRSILSDEESAMILANLIEENFHGQSQKNRFVMFQNADQEALSAGDSGAATPRKRQPTYTRRRAPSRPNKYNSLKRSTSTSEVRRIKQKRVVPRRRLQRTFSDPVEGEKEAAKAVRAKLEGQRFSSFLSLYTHRVLHLSKRSLAKADQGKRRTISGGDKAPLPEQAAENKLVVVEEATPPVVEEPKHLDKFVKPLIEISKNPEVVAFIVTNFLIWLVFYLPSLFIDDWGTHLGMSADETTLLLSLVGLGNAVGRPIVAFFGDRFHHKRVMLFVGMVALGGVISIAAPHYGTFNFLAFFVLTFSLLNGGAQLMILPVLGDMIPMEKVGFTFSVLIAVEGIAVLLGAPLLALLPTYDMIFSVAGYILIAGAIILAFVSYAKKMIGWMKRHIPMNF